MKPASCKAKGRVLQNQVCEDLLVTLKDLRPGDIRPAIMGETGCDIKLSPAAREVFPWGLECKNRESLNIWQAWSQAQKNAKAEHQLPALVVKRNRQDPLIVMSWKTFLEMIV